MQLPVIAKSEVPLLAFSMPRRRYMRDGEIEVLLSLVESVRPSGMLEFGVNDGLTARAVLDNIETIESYQGIDVPQGYVTAREAQRREVPEQPGRMVNDDPRFELIIRARGSLDLVASDLEPCDVAFIDGDHGRNGVEHDTGLARAVVRPGGIIIWHDYHDLGTVDVRDVLHDFRAAGLDIKHVEDTWLAFERV